MKALALTTVSVLLLISSLAGAQTVSISPGSQSAIFPANATITVQASSMSGLYGFQFDLIYDPSRFSLKEIVEGTFLREGNPPDTITFCMDPDTSTPGIIRNYACTRQGEESGVSGSGALAVINLSVKSNAPLGTSYVNLTNLKLSDINSEPISAGITNGTVSVQLCQNGQQYECGDTDEGECEYGTKTCTDGAWGSCEGEAGPTNEVCDGLDNDCDGDTDEDWPNLGESCTAGLGECENSGVYECSTDGQSAECGAAPGIEGTETCPPNGKDEDCDGEDLLCLGDARGGDNSDSCVNVFDLSLVGTHFGETSSDASWNQDSGYADLNSDGEIDIFDLVLVGANFGEEYEDGACNQ